MNYPNKFQIVLSHILFRITVFIFLSIAIYFIASDYREFAIVMIPVFLSQLLAQISSNEQNKVVKDKATKAIQVVVEGNRLDSAVQKEFTSSQQAKSSSNSDIYDWLKQENLIDEYQYKHLKVAKQK